LKDDVTGGFTADNFQLIRFHGMYQQDDRDIRAERIKQRLEPLHNVMLRARLPGGVIKPEQWLVIDKFAGDYTMYGSIRLTTRQTFQFHGVLKPNMKLMHQTLHKAGIDSIATAGDVNRNVHQTQLNHKYINKLGIGRLKSVSIYCLRPMPTLKFG
jgi:sulfite reductase (NADPH) hemoprotein beta-component